jgi:hypothetical protein
MCSRVAARLAVASKQHRSKNAELDLKYLTIVSNFAFSQRSGVVIKWFYGTYCARMYTVGETFGLHSTLQLKSV